MNKEPIPFNWPLMTGKELHYIAEATIRGSWLGRGHLPSAVMSGWNKRDSLYRYPSTTPRFLNSRIVELNAPGPVTRLHREQIQSARRRLWENYQRELNGWAADNGAQLPTIPPECEQSCHIFYLILPSIDRGQALISHLLQREILVVFHYLPLHLSPMGRHFGGCEGDCPVTEKIADRLLRLPFYTGMTDLEQTQVIDAVCAFRC
jgi:dTDP-4-amino-4,6-dideoxygalactose transaminase